MSLLLGRQTPQEKANSLLSIESSYLVFLQKTFFLKEYFVFSLRKKIASGRKGASRGVFNSLVADADNQTTRYFKMKALK